MIKGAAGALVYSAFSLLFHARNGERTLRHQNHAFNFADFAFCGGKRFFDRVKSTGEKHIAGHIAVKLGHEVVLRPTLGE